MVLAWRQEVNQGLRRLGGRSRDRPFLGVPVRGVTGIDENVQNYMTVMAVPLGQLLKVIELYA